MNVNTKQQKLFNLKQKEKGQEKKVQAIIYYGTKLAGLIHRHGIPIENGRGQKRYLKKKWPSIMFSKFDEYYKLSN